MGILSWIVMGLAAGILFFVTARRKLASRAISVIIAGIFGALIAGFVGSWLGMGSANEFHLRTLLMSALGAVVLIIMVRTALGWNQRDNTP